MINMIKCSRKMIEVSLIDIKQDARIRCFRDLRTAEQFIDRNAEYIDLLVWIGVFLKPVMILLFYLELVNYC